MQDNPFVDMPHTPAQHFKLYFYAAVMQLIEQLSYAFDSWEEVLKQFPFLGGYYEELARHGLNGRTLDEAQAFWRGSLEEWERAADVHLPLNALGAAACLDYSTLVLLFTVGLVEEDARFGAIFEALQGGSPGSQQHAPKLGLLGTWWQPQDDEYGGGGRNSNANGSCGSGGARASLRQLEELGLVRIANREAPRAEHGLHVPIILWDVIQGEVDASVTRALAPWVRYHAPDDLSCADELIAASDITEQFAMLPGLFESGEAEALIVRGPQHNGRKTLMGATARVLGRGMLEASGLGRADDERWRQLGVLATLMRALPVVVLDLSPGETSEIPRLEGYRGALGVVLGKQGGITGTGVERALTWTLETPAPEERREHWRQGFGGHAEGDDMDEIVERFRMTGGNIRRAAKLATAYAALDGRIDIRLEDVRRASRALNRQALDTLAVRIETTGDWSRLAVKTETMRELRNLESRCRHRERLRETVGESFRKQLNAGVRALFSGPSGTGKTLAARLLASVLSMDLYRLDLASVVNKYIGETEKSLNQIFARAEELDVVLLLDEGDALLTQRTNVQSSNDRYANLETNYLLQRLESFEGIIIITTNASERIDTAFQRRMDVVVDFHAPEPSELWAIWQLHLPREHAIPATLLGEVARRCALNGGQIRNAVLHASLLALNDGGQITSAHLEAAVQREYRKSGAVCPLRPNYFEALSPN